MRKHLLLFSFFVFILFSCARKHSPDKTTITTTTTTIGTSPGTNPIKTDSTVVVKKRNFTPTKKDIIPNSITVNDAAAKKAVDGRMYYDLLGHRYWKNYKDGKYYLFSQKMYDNPAFKPPK